MTPGSDDDRTDAEIAADREADAMTDRLRKDVASWAASQAGDAAEPETKFTPKPRPVAPPAKRAAPKKAKVAEPVKPATTEKKPFKMSYDGTTDKDYIAQRLKLGSR